MHGTQLPCPPKPLSPSQKSYRDNPSGFLERLKARAEGLFHDGYTVYPGDTLHAFLVAYHEAKGNRWVTYEVVPLLGSCTCPFYARQQDGEYLGDDETLVACKHLRGLAALIRATCKRHASEGNITDCCFLWQHWMVTLSHLRRERIEREKRMASDNHQPNDGQKGGVTADRVSAQRKDRNDDATERSGRARSRG